MLAKRQGLLYTCLASGQNVFRGEDEVTDTGVVAMSSVVRLIGGRVCSSSHRRVPAQSQSSLKLACC